VVALVGESCVGSVNRRLLAESTLLLTIASMTLVTPAAGRDVLLAPAVLGSLAVALGRVGAGDSPGDVGLDVDLLGDGDGRADGLLDLVDGRGQLPHGE
jgi:hypothetical protein